jgi:hypothetical protein
MTARTERSHRQTSRFRGCQKSPAARAGELEGVVLRPKTYCPAAFSRPRAEIRHGLGAARIFGKDGKQSATKLARGGAHGAVASFDIAEDSRGGAHGSGIDPVRV